MMHFRLSYSLQAQILGCQIRFIIAMQELSFNLLITVFCEFFFSVFHECREAVQFQFWIFIYIMWYTAVMYRILLPAPYDAPQFLRIEQASTASTVNLTYQPPMSPNGEINNYTVC